MASLDKLQFVEVEADVIKLKVGTLEVDLDSKGRGTVNLDGREVLTRSLTVHVDVESVPKIVLEVVPEPADPDPVRHPLEVLDEMREHADTCGVRFDEEQADEPANACVKDDGRVA